jgi:hypothetical protein
MVEYASAGLLLQHLLQSDKNLRLANGLTTYMLKDETVIDYYREDWSCEVAEIPRAAMRRACRQAYLYGMVETRVKGTHRYSSSTKDFWTGTGGLSPDETRPARFKLTIVVQPDGPKLSVEETVR